MTSLIKQFWMEEDGQDMVEYALLLAFVALAAVTILSQAGTSINGLFTKMSNALSSANASATQ